MSVLETLRERVLVCDGAMGTMLQQRGMPPDACPEVWALEHPEALLQIHQEYLNAGADVILTATFGANGLKLQKYDVRIPVSELSRRLAEIALQAVSDDQFVLGDIGPTGDFMQPLGLATEDDFYQAFAAQAEGFLKAGVAGIIVETMMDLSEAQIAVKAAKETGLPVLASMSYNPDPNGFRTMMGVSPEQAVEGLLEAGADGIGTNCGSVLMEHMPDLVAQLLNAGSPCVLVEANAGIPEMVDGQTVFNQTPEQMAAGVSAVIQAGVSLVGGCCGTTPEHIRGIANIIKGNNS